MVRKEQQKWLKSKSTLPEGRSLLSPNIRDHFHSPCKTGVSVQEVTTCVFINQVHSASSCRGSLPGTEYSQKEKERKKATTINHTPDVHSAFSHPWRMTSLFSYKHVDGHPPPNTTLITYFNPDINHHLLAVRGQFIFHVHSVSGPSEEPKYHRAD